MRRRAGARSVTAMTEPARAPSAGAVRTGAWSRVRSLDPRVTDPLLALVLAGVGLASLAAGVTDAEHPTTPDVWAYGLTVIGFGALAFRTRAPMTSLAVSLVAVVAFSAIEYPENGLPIACMVALYTVASRTPPQRSVLAALAVVVAIILLTAIGSQGLDPAGAVGNLAVFGVAYAIGRYVRVRRAYTEQLELRAADAEESRRRDAEQAVAAERLRIARELHDVVAHAMSIVAVQSGVAAHVIDDQPDQARAMLGTINTVSREALDEMRRMLGVLRAGNDDPVGELVPAPTLGDVRSLADSVQGTGLTVGLQVRGDAVELTPGLDLAAYRIVQEALTNVVKHAGPAQVEIVVTYEPDAVVITVTDDGRGAASGTTSGGGGHGLVGMQERVDLYDGTLDAGPRTGGGFAVTARLPYRTGAVLA